jgi:hypothetical protein
MTAGYVFWGRRTAEVDAGGGISVVFTVVGDWGFGLFGRRPADEFHLAMHLGFDSSGKVGRVVATSFSNCTRS